VNERILIVDDEAGIRTTLAGILEDEGYRVTLAATAAEARDAALREPCDLVLLDLALPDQDGLSLCKELRGETDVPILMLTARGEVADRVVGLELGADDYLPKPFEPRELVARIESILRRARGRETEQRLVSGDLVVDPGRRAVTLEGRGVDLTTLEFELLQVLMQSRGRVLTRDQLLTRLRGLDADVYDRSVDMLVSRLRQKLGDDARAPRFIKTVWGAGYQFVGGDR